MVAGKIVPEYEILGQMKVFVHVREFGMLIKVNLGFWLHLGRIKGHLCRRAILGLRCNSLLQVIIITSLKTVSFTTNKNRFPKRCAVS